MRTFKPQFKQLLFILCVFISLNTFSQNSFKRIIVLNPSKEVIKLLDQNGIDLTCGVVATEQSIQLEIGQSELNVLDQLGISYVVIIDNLEKFYSERAKNDLPKASATLNQLKLSAKNNKAKGIQSKSIGEIINNVGQYTGETEIDWEVPANWKLNDAINYPTETNHFGGCLTYTMVEAELDLMKAKYGNIISTKVNASPSGQLTGEGRTVWMVRISDNAESDEPEEPETLYQSLIHSREAATVMNQLYFMWYLLENYDTDPAIKNLVNNQALYFIPVFNPDGFVYNQTVAPNGGGGQRKNRNTSGSNSCTTYLNGIDLNRNSAYYWGNGGSSTDPCSDTYMGIGPFSENETQIMRDFFLQHDFKMALNHHSYKNAMLHGYAGTTITNPRPDEYSKYSHDMSFYSRFSYGPSTNISYLNSGNMNDWMLGGPAGTSANGTPTGTGSGKHTLSWTPENGLYSQGTGGTYGGFWPAPSNYLPIAKNAMRMNFLAAYYSGKYAKLHDFNQSNITTTSGNLKFAIENLGQNGGDPTPLTNAFTLTVTAVSSNITITGGIVTENFTTAQILEQRNVAIGYTLNSGIQPNDKIEYKVTLTNDYASDNVLYEANIVKYYNPTVLFSDNPDVSNLTNWTQTGTWYTTATGGYLGTKGITASNTIPYANSVSKKLQMNSSVNLTGVTETLVQFHAKWDLERSFDYVQIEGYNGTTWVPLTGKYTKPGATNASNPYDNKTTTEKYFQPDNEMLYDGDTQGKWVMEEIVINSSTNSSLYNKGAVYFRFDFNTNTSNTEDSYYNMDFEGFTFDDFKVIKIVEPCVLSVPTNVFASAVTSTSATISWDNIPSATYDLRYRVVGATTWIDVNDLISASYSFSSLSIASQYEVQVRTKCDTNNSSYTSSVNFKTTVINYCNSSGDDGTYFYISNVNFGSINNNSANSNTGYSDYTSLNTSLVLGTSNAISIAKFFTGSYYRLATSVWIDYNKDGDFEDAGEKVLSNGASSVTPITANINIPATASIGSTRMRVISKYYSTSGLTADDPCESFSYGEVEDYTVNIIDSTLGIEDEILNTFTMYPNPSATGEVTIKMPNEINEFTVSVSNLLGQQVLTKKFNRVYNNIHTISTAHLKEGVYYVSVKTDLGKATKKIVLLNQ